MQMCASTVLIFAKGNHQYEYSASYVTPALSIYCIATNGQWLASNIKLLAQCPCACGHFSTSM